MTDSRKKKVREMFIMHERAYFTANISKRTYGYIFFLFSLPQGPYNNSLHQQYFIVNLKNK